jgi:hypothetical protein
VIVEKINSGEYAEYSLNETVLTLDGVDYDLVALQEDEQNIIDVKVDDRFIANIIIPPAKYKEIDSGNVDDNNETIYKKVKVPLDIESVKLNLWAIHKDENQNTQGEL